MRLMPHHTSTPNTFGNPNLMALRWRRRWATTAAAVLLVAGSGCVHPPGPSAGSASSFLPPEPPSGYTPKTLSRSQKDMVAAAHPLAVQAGVAMLAQGGSAIDAAIAVQLVLNVVEPQSSGIGGGAFLLHFAAPGTGQPQGQLLAYDGRETAPASATPALFTGPDGKPLPFLKAVDGGRSVGTPGLLRMLETAHRAHGRLAWAQLFAPAIRLAEEGFAISPRLSVSIAGVATRIKAQGEPAASYFLNADGSAKATGTWLKSPELAATLRAVATSGADAFYTGHLAQAMVAKVQGHPSNPGGLTLADLAAYKPQVREPVCGVYRVAYRICGMGPPSSGGIAVLQTLGLLERFDVRAMGPNSLDAVHTVSEAYRLAYADRALYVADPAFVNVPVAGLLNPAYLQTRSALIKPANSLGAPAAGVPPGAQMASWGADASAALPSTSHVSVVDSAGNAVSMTTTIENGFGSLQMVGGFLLNNQLTDFSFVAQDAQGRTVANRVEAGKRPRSSMAPTMVFNASTGALEAVVGSPGGSAIIQYVTKTLVGLIDWRLDIQQAINLPNFGAQTSPVTQIEKGSLLDTPSMADGLKSRGHTVQVTEAFTSGLHGWVFNGVRPNGQRGALAMPGESGQYLGGADPRREGVAAGH